MVEVTGPANPVDPTFTTETLPPEETESRGILRGLPGSGRRTPPKDTPPKRKSSPRRTSTDAPSKPAVDALPDGALAKALADTYGQIGLFVGMMDPVCGTAIIENAMAMGSSLEALSKESPATKEFLQKLITTSAVGKVIAAHLPVGIAILAHHVPAIRNRFNPGNPEHADSGIGPNVKNGNAA